MPGYNTSAISKKFAVLIPVYNHNKMIAGVINKALELHLPVIVIDDGSTDSTFDKIKNINDIILIRHPLNMGKGAAILTGFKKAAGIADWAITIDGDGQHDPADALKLIKAIPENCRPIVVGMRKDMTGEDVPWTSRFGRKFSNFWIRASGGPKVMDSQSGFRIYPLPESLNLGIKSQRYQFEVEILVRAKRAGIPVLEIPVSVDYSPGEKRISHFRPFVDFLRNTKTFTCLIAERILTPRLFRLHIRNY